jgi:hypothetical protein
MALIISVLPFVSPGGYTAHDLFLFESDLIAGTLLEVTPYDTFQFLLTMRLT